MIDPSATPSGASPPDRPKPVVLIADDEPPILSLLETKFTRAGFKVLTATDGQAAWDVARRQRLDLLITDYRMPLLDGLDLCARLLTHPNTRDLPVLVITSPYCKVASEFRQLGNVVGLVEKPLKPQDLVDKASQFVGCRFAPPVRPPDAPSP